MKLFYLVLVMLAVGLGAVPHARASRVPPATRTVCYTDLDAIMRDRGRAYGKLARIAVWRGLTATAEFMAHDADCLVPPRIRFSPPQRAMVSRIPTEPTAHLRPIVFRVLRYDGNTIVGQLIAVGG